ncbi:hypothetical protein AJ80_00695 [Polytolypa hystricis UAMH7299]|uniref:magnesium chelatase n=1 Tax=Polytolypa hystricis (strain UAMH7299) TaxID=1447883 RepID=A0A2B7Z2P9_POLH7|nr:hypothetical protein AJ80_00695 [Polytolypa hystricis UAMH7299]
MEFPGLFDRIEDLSDLEIAILLCLVAKEHCIIDTQRDVLDDLETELRLVATNIFGLSHAVLNCSRETSLEDFSNSILSHDTERVDYDRLSSFGASAFSPDRYTGSISRSSRRFSEKSRDKASLRRRSNYLDERKVVNIIIAKNFDHAPEEVQLQALDLMRTRRIFSRTSVHTTPKTFLFIPLVASDPRGLSSLLNKHLNDHMFVSYHHDPRDGFPNLEDDSGWLSDDQGSMSSVIRKPILSFPKPNDQSVLINEDHINTLRQLSENVTLSADVNSYLHNLIVFLRLNRAVAGGISATATSHFHQLVRCLAPLQQVDYVFPSLVAVAARKIYRHRIIVANPENDRSLLYGSTLMAVEAILAGATAEGVIEDVIAEVEAPL